MITLTQCKIKWMISLTLLLCSCDISDDQNLMQDAREQCLRITVSYLKEISNNDRKFSFKIPMNTSDDPIKNTYEFIWDDHTIQATPPIFGLWIKCRGDANSKEILSLLVNGENIIRGPQKY